MLYMYQHQVRCISYKYHPVCLLVLEMIITNKTCKNLKKNKQKYEENKQTKTWRKNEGKTAMKLYERYRKEKFKLCMKYIYPKSFISDTLSKTHTDAEYLKITLFTQ